MPRSARYVCASAPGKNLYSLPSNLIPEGFSPSACPLKVTSIGCPCRGAEAENDTVGVAAVLDTAKTNNESGAAISPNALRNTNLIPACQIHCNSVSEVPPAHSHTKSYLDFA